MDELNWLTTNNLDEMLRYLAVQPHLPIKLVDRKLLYWIAEVVRTQRQNEPGAALIEGFADGKVTVKELRYSPSLRSIAGGAGRWLHRNVPLAAQQITPQRRQSTDWWRQPQEEEPPPDQQAMIEHLRELFGNPWVPPNSFWRSYAGGLVQRLADEIILDGAWDLMPILGDALEDAGCAHPDVLEHCRARVRHCKGCWVLDLIGMDE
jgi:hypothetical protein